MNGETSINVLLLADQLELRGTSAYTLRLAEYLPQHRITPKVICPDASLVDPELRKRLTIEERPYIEIPFWGWFFLKLLKHDVYQTRFDLIHVQSRRMVPAGMWLAEHLGVPFIVTVHDFLQPREQLLFDQTLGKRIICVSDTVKTDLLNRTGLPETLFSVIRSGVEVPPEQQLQSVLEPGHVPVVGTAGPLETLKGLPFFLGAAQKILASSHDVEFLIAGTGPEERNLRRLARELGIADHVTFITKLYDFGPSLSAIDIFCQPSLRQGLGTIMLEAMALGKPVIATGVDELYRLVHDGVNGLVVPPSDSSQLALKIVELLNDPLRARSLGQAGRKMVLEEFGVASMVDRTVRLYHEVLQSAPVASEV